MPYPYEKEWQTRYGTASLSVRLHPTIENYFGLNDEELEAWEVVDVPSQDEMEGFSGTEAPSTVMNADSNSSQEAEHAEDASSQPPGEEKMKEEEDIKENSELIDAKQKKRKDPDESPLYPCSRCASYHYIESCIYILSKPKWLEYHHTYLGSQPMPADPEYSVLEDSVKKHERMTRSGRRMMAEDLEWKKRFASRKPGEGLDYGDRWLALDETKAEKAERERENRRRAIMRKMQKGI